jgi:hypothetical protein
MAIEIKLCFESGDDDAEVDIDWDGNDISDWPRWVEEWKVASNLICQTVLQADQVLKWGEYEVINPDAALKDQRSRQIYPPVRNASLYFSADDDHILGSVIVAPQHRKRALKAVEKAFAKVSKNYVSQTEVPWPGA